MLPKIFSTAASDTKDIDSTAITETDTGFNEAQPVTQGADEPTPANGEPPEPSTKMARATDIYRRMTRKKGTTRKEIVAAFIGEVGLTKAGAATYFQMIKKGRR